ncbi:MAG: isoprenylcysteine carboxyl methyltransferase family protein [Ectobacillus sp.]
MKFALFFIFIVMQRSMELLVARRNEKRLKQKGALEFGKRHYKYMVLLHTMFLAALLFEVQLFQREISPLWPLLLLLFIGTQLLRVWAIASLGEYWNTKIIVLPNADVVATGPYKWLRHPNYTVVILEILFIPFLFQAYITAMLFTFLNGLILYVRIQEEEKALSQITNYEEKFQNISRFTP